MLYRAFFALPKSIKGVDGKPVNALLGTANLILRELEVHPSRAVVLCFGPDAADYRVELYEPYHAERPPVPDELAPQFADAPAFFDAFGWTSAIATDLEADDVMGSLARAEADAGGEALLMTGDRDLFQCVGERVTVLYVRTGSKGGAEVVDEADVQRRYGIPPSLVPDFIALRGDPSDGLPGAKGIGEKTAADLLRRHGSLEAAIAGAVRERPTVRRALLQQADELAMFKDLATLRPAPVEPPPDRPTDAEQGAAAAEAVGMKRLAQRFGG